MILGKNVNLYSITKTTVFLLKSMRPKYLYADGTRTGQQVGWSYTLGDPTECEQFSVAVEGEMEPVITRDELLLAQAKGEKVWVELVEAKVRVYQNYENHTVGETITAEGITLVDTDGSTGFSFE